MRVCVWRGRAAIANVGLDGEAIMGPKWEKHRGKLLRQFIGMLDYGNVCGLCLGEVGSFDHPSLTRLGREWET